MDKLFDEIYDVKGHKPALTRVEEIVKEVEDEFKGIETVGISREKEELNLKAKKIALKKKLDSIKNPKRVKRTVLTERNNKLRQNIRNQLQSIELRLSEICIEKKVKAEDPDKVETAKDRLIKKMGDRYVSHEEKEKEKKKGDIGWGEGIDLLGIKNFSKLPEPE